jgi:hypothetical protein
VPPHRFTTVPESSPPSNPRFAPRSKGLHTGAKVRPARPVGAPVHDPTGLLAWVAPDRATVAFPDAVSVASSRDALVAVIQEWITRL